MQCARRGRPLPDAVSPCICTLAGTGLPSGAELASVDSATLTPLPGTIASYRDATVIARQIDDGLAAALGAGVVHRDVCHDVGIRTNVSFPELYGR
jgi:hypothetical protein